MTKTCLNPKIAFVNVWSDQNRGDAAIVLATCEAVRNSYPDCIIDFHNVAFGPKELKKYQDKHFGSFDPDTHKIYPAIYPALTDGENGPRISRLHRIFFSIRSILLLILGWFHPRFPLVLLSRKERQAYRELIQSDLVISKGGSYLLANSWKDIPQILMVMFPLMLGSVMRIRTLLLGVSIGPANSVIASRFLRFCLSFVDQIVLREEYAMETCLRLKIPKEKLTLLPDLALYSVACEEKHPKEPEELINLERPIIGVTVRLWAFDDVGDREIREPRYFEAVANALQKFHDSTGGTILFIPQVIGPNEEGSDIQGIRNVTKLIKDSNIYQVLPIDLDVRKLRSIYANIDLLLGTRLHSCLMAYGTPTTMIGYQGDKSIGSAKLLGCEDRFVHINEISQEQLLSALNKTWDEKKSIREDAETRLKQFKQQYQSVLPDLIELEEFPIPDNKDSMIHPKRSLGKKRRRSSLLRIVGTSLLFMITIYSIRFIQLRKGIEEEFHRRNAFHTGSVDGLLTGYYLEPPLDENQIGESVKWKISDNTIVNQHPDLLATLALQHFTYWKQGNQSDKKELARSTFFNLSEEIQNLFVYKKSSSGQKFAVVEYHFNNPWYPQLSTPWRSGLAQGRCLSVLARHYQEKPDPELLKLIENIIVSYRIPVEEGGIKSEQEDAWFYEEIAQAPATHILNGHIIALWGLYDVYRVTGDQNSFRLFQKGMEAVVNNLNQYDTFPWSSYDLGPHMWAGTANPKYQLMHARQMKILFEMTKNSDFLKYAQQWEEELNSWVNQISYLFTKDYYRVTRKVKTICY